MSAEHYSWVATGDKSNPDAASVQSRAAAFLSKLDALFVQGHILGIPDTYTGVTLGFLKGTKRFPCGNGVQTVGIGDWQTEPRAREAIQAALRRVQGILSMRRRT